MMFIKLLDSESIQKDEEVCTNSMFRAKTTRPAIHTQSIVYELGPRNSLDTTLLCLANITHGLKCRKPHILP